MTPKLSLGPCTIDRVASKLSSHRTRRPSTVRAEKRRTLAGVKHKTLSKQARSGQVGINTIEAIVLGMGSKWSPNISNDVGIDGNIEFFDPRTGRAVGQVVAVQSKVHTGKLPGETDDDFSWTVRQSDLDYWLSLNVPVLLIVVRPPDEAYWISIRDAFATAVARKSRQVRLRKEDHRFQADRLGQLVSAIAPASVAATLTTVRREQLSSNLLPVGLPKRVMLAETEVREPRELAATLREHHCRDGAWVLHEGRVLSFHDLREPPWPLIVDRGSVDDFDAQEWGATDDADQARVFNWLLGRTLSGQLYPEVRFWKEERRYAFRAGRATLVPGEFRDWKIKDPVTGRSRQVFSSWRARKDGHRIAYRHLGADLNFVCFEGLWFLAIIPGYVFTRDGWEISRYHGAGTTSMKRLEHNETFRGQVRFWSTYLRRDDLIASNASLLTFGAPLEFAVEAGVDDAAWLRRSPGVEAEAGLWPDEDEV